MAISTSPVRLLVLLLMLALLPSFHSPEPALVRIALPSANDGMVSPPLKRMALLPVGRDLAHKINAATPFASSRGPLAKPFGFGGEPASRARAIDCLASAMWYEAGGDPDGELAVGQVVLNRVRHPAFPNSVCATVFQGSERNTGCQFTFTCDGSLLRRAPGAAFDRARALARAMLAGTIDEQVGLATHYHTDWVRPVWSPAMDKVAKVDTHLFFRWRGAWGKAAAMRQAYGGHEPNVPALASISPAHHGLGAVPEDAAAAAPAGLIPSAEPVPVPLAAKVPDMPKPSSSIRLDVSLAPGPSAPAMAALDLCGTRPVCKVLGSTPDGNTAFVYVRDRRTGVEKALWNCSQFPRRNGEQCISDANRHWIDFEGNL